jgi:hypothetical protein
MARPVDSGGLPRQPLSPRGVVPLREPIACAPVHWAEPASGEPAGGAHMNGIIYLIGLIVVIMAILSFLGLR